MRGNFITSGNGSAVYGGTLSNCIVAGSSASEGYTTSFSRLNNCTIVQNRNGADECTLNNCILYYSGENYGSNTFNHCCTTPMPTNGFGNITNEPLFLDLNAGNLRLHSNSPCINSGKNTYAPAGPDLDGNPRIVGGTVDIGAYEFQNPASMISYAWLQLYGFPTDVSADLQDTDSDGMNNFQEWIAGTNPTNALSVLMMLAPSNSVSGIAVSWQSVSGITYFLQHGTNLGVQPAFASVQSNLVGQAGVTAFTDTNAIGQGPFFYRVGVQQ
jgi:hypothetical protein